MMRIEKIVNSVFNSNTYVIGDDGEEIWLVDCGDVEQVIGRGRRIAGVLLTHAHFDHIYGLPRLLEECPEVKVYTNAAGVEALASSKRNFSRYHGEPIEIEDSRRVVSIDEGDELTVLGERVKIYHTPGHNPSCLCYQFGEALFTGDSLIPGVKTITNLPGGNKALALASELRIKAIAEGNGLAILPGHTLSEAP